MKQNGYQPLQREYSRLARRYDTRWKSYTEASIGETLRRVQFSAGDRVLDVGCGTGTLLLELSRSVEGLKPAGVDVSDEMLKVARKKLGPLVDLKLAPAESLPFEDAGFDVLVSTNVFHFILDPLDALHEMQRVLKPQGKLVITDWCGDFPTCRVLGTLLNVFNRAHVKTYGADEFHELLAKSNFSKVGIDRYKISWLWGLMTANAEKGAG